MVMCTGKRVEDVSDLQKYLTACTDTHDKDSVFLSSGIIWDKGEVFFFKKKLNLYKSALKKSFKRKTVINLLSDDYAIIPFISV